MNPPVALSVAGSDASGGAGVAADLTTFAALGAHGTAVITAVTAQNTVGVQGVHSVPADFVVQQLDSVLDDLPVGGVKTGMLANREIIAVVGDYAAAGRLPNLVVDPVMVVVYRGPTAGFRSRGPLPRATGTRRGGHPQRPRGRGAPGGGRVGRIGKAGAALPRLDGGDR